MNMSMDEEEGDDFFGSETTVGMMSEIVNNTKNIQDTKDPFLENIQMLDAAPQGSGEFVYVSVPKWDINFVSRLADLRPSPLNLIPLG